MKHTLFDTRIAKGHGIEAQLPEAVEFLIKNRQLIEITKRDIDAILRMRAISTPMTKVFENVSRHMENFFIMDLSKITSGIPEILTMDEIAINGASIQQSVPEYLQKGWINITGIVDRKLLQSDVVSISDNDKFISMVVKSALTASYDKADNLWLTQKSTVALIQLYTMTIAPLLRRIYNLDPTDLIVPNIVFAAYYAQRLTNSSDTNVPAILNRCAFLGDMRTITEVLEEVPREGSGEITLEGAIAGIGKAGNQKLAKLSSSALFRMFTSASVDNVSLLAAVEYPPYFLHQLLKLVSGNKNYIFNSLSNSRAGKKLVEELAKDLEKSNLLAR